jgi:hypothetical protein
MHPGRAGNHSKEQQAFLNRFISMASHEFKTPIKQHPFLSSPYCKMKGLTHES